MLQQVSNPFGVFHVRLSSRNGFEMLRIDHEDLHMPFQDVKDRLPKAARTCHRDMGDPQVFEEGAHAQQFRRCGAKGPPLLVPLALGIRSAGADKHVPLVHVQARTSFIHQVHQSPPVEEWAGDGMPKLGQMLPYVLRRYRRATDGGACGASGITLVVRLATRVSNRSLTWHPPCSYSTLFHARWCATGHTVSLSARSCLVMQCLFVDEDMPWVCYIWPCSARPKYFMTAVASRFPYARRRPCLSTWRSKAACIPAASWQPYYGPTVILLS